MKKWALLFIFYAWVNQDPKGQIATGQDIVWYVPGQPQAPMAKPNPPNIIPDPSIAPETPATASLPPTAPPTTTPGSPGDTSAPTEAASAPLGYIAGLGSFIWGSPSKAAPAPPDPSAVATIPTVPSDLIVKICAVADLDLDALCPAAGTDPGCTSLASALGAQYRPECARMGLCSVVEATANARLFVWKVPKAASCTTMPVRVSFVPPKRGKKSGEDFVKLTGGSE